MQATLIMRNLFNYVILVVSAKYTIKYLLSSVRALVLEKRMHFV